MRAVYTEKRLIVVAVGEYEFVQETEPRFRLRDILAPVAITTLKNTNTIQALEERKALFESGISTIRIRIVTKCWARFGTGVKLLAPFGYLREIIIAGTRVKFSRR